MLDVVTPRISSRNQGGFMMSGLFPYQHTHIYVYIYTDIIYIYIILDIYIYTDIIKTGHLCKTIFFAFKICIRIQFVFFL